MFCSVRQYAASAGNATRRTLRGARIDGVQSSYHAWECKDRKKGNKGNGCKNRTIREEELLRMISDKMGWESFDEELFDKTVEQVEIYKDRITVKKYSR